MEKYLTIQQAADYLNVSVPTLRWWEYDGKIKPFRTTGNQAAKNILKRKNDPEINLYTPYKEVQTILEKRK